jgi:hypothetical protein
LQHFLARFRYDGFRYDGVFSTSRHILLLPLLYLQRPQSISLPYKPRRHLRSRTILRPCRSLGTSWPISPTFAVPYRTNSHIHVVYHSHIHLLTTTTLAPPLAPSISGRVHSQPSPVSYHSFASKRPMSCHHTTGGGEGGRTHIGSNTHRVEHTSGRTHIGSNTHRVVDVAIFTSLLSKLRSQSEKSPEFFAPLAAPRQPQISTLYTAQFLRNNGKHRAMRVLL